MSDHEKRGEKKKGSSSKRSRPPSREHSRKKQSGNPSSGGEKRRKPSSASSKSSNSRPGKNSEAKKYRSSEKDYDQPRGKPRDDAGKKHSRKPASGARNRPSGRQKDSNRRTLPRPPLRNTRESEEKDAPRIRSLRVSPGSGRKGQFSSEKPEATGAIRALRNSLHGESSGEVQSDLAYRINRYLSLCGFGSRREVERYVLEKRVTLDGEVVENLNTRVEPGSIVFVDGRPVRPPGKYLYYAMNKPAGILVSKKGFLKSDRTIYDLLPDDLQALNYAGRLDRESRGLVILSTDGDFINYVAHPSRRILKRYEVTVNRLPSELELREAFVRGIEDEGELLRVLNVTVLDRDKKLVEILMGHGKNRQIRRMFRALNIRVVDLYRTSVGYVDLRELELKDGEIQVFDPGYLLHKTPSIVEGDDASILGDFHPWAEEN